jgi:hypothetical protein
MNEDVKVLKAQLQQAIKERDEASRRAVDSTIQQTFIVELTTFHRTSLQPLVMTTKQILEHAKQGASPELLQRIAELMRYLSAVDDRCKHFNGQDCVQVAQQAVASEQKRLEVKTAP